MSLNKSDLMQFTGSETWYRHGLVPKVLYTDGVKYVADKAGAYWLIDKIATNQMLPQIKKEDFQTWTLTVHEKGKADLVATDGNKHEIYRERIDWTDFPLDTITFWVEYDTIFNTILLPSEH